MARSRLKSLQRRLRGSGGDRTSSVLLVALGAAAGVALGMILADRVGGVDGLLRRGGLRGRRRPRLDGWRRGTERSDTFDMLADDDTELSPESIAHMHMADAHSAHAHGTDAHGADAHDTDAPTTGVAGTRTGRGGPLPDRRPADSRIARRGASRVQALPVRQVPDEAALEARVLEAFINDPILRERAIDICASGTGTIELTGWVQAASEIGHALTLARGVPDVTAVVDRLAVRGADLPRDHSSHRYAGPSGGTESAARGD